MSGLGFVECLRQARGVPTPTFKDLREVMFPFPRVAAWCWSDFGRLLISRRLGSTQANPLSRSAASTS